MTKQMFSMKMPPVMAMKASPTCQWFCTLKINRSRMKNLLLAVSLFFASSSFAGIETQDWQTYLTKSCQVSVVGSAKKMFGELNFWAHVDVSMNAWAADMMDSSPQNFCYARFQQLSQKVDLMRCLAYIDEQLEWFKRCKPIVVLSCRQAGGRC